MSDVINQDGVGLVAEPRWNGHPTCSHLCGTCGIVSCDNGSLKPGIMFDDMVF